MVTVGPNFAQDRFTEWLEIFVFKQISMSICCLEKATLTRHKICSLTENL